jgi:glycosyltransferase involved in cell wall biosynthesis
MGMVFMSEKVSVIIPTYKRSEFLERAIESVLNQSYSNLEIVVVDDNEIDSRYRIDTEKEMLKYSKDPRVVYIKNKRNVGGALARNIGINQATGDYIAFLDDDDIYLQDKIKDQLEYMLETRYDMSFTDVRFHNTNDRLIDYRKHSYIRPNITNEELLKKHLMHHLTPTSTYMIKKESLLKIGCFDNVKMGQEFMLMLKAINNGLEIGYIPIAKTIQYVHEGERISVGQNKLDKEIELYRFKKKYFNRMKNREIQYIKFRHNMVMTVVLLRCKKYNLSIKHLMLAFFLSPFDFAKEFLFHILKLVRYR